MGSVMKANEFSPQRKSQTKPSADQASPTTVAETTAPQVQEKKIIKKARSTTASAEGALYGIDDPHGTEVRRIRERHPEIWKKIKNWDWSEYEYIITQSHWGQDAHISWENKHQHQC